ncbi:MAG: DUF4365 domain-containing protein [Flavobacterium sp.]
MSDWPIASEEDRGGRIGVHIVGTKVHKFLKWVFRETSSTDLGIDGEIEVRNEDQTSHGRVISVQIKCGASFLEEVSDHGFVYRGSMKHLRYWLEHTSPVIVILCNPDDEKCWWETIDLQKIKIHEKGWSIEVPFSNELDFSAIGDLIKIANRLQKKDLVELLLRDWLGWSFEHRLRLASIFASPRDYHWFSHLGSVDKEYFMIDYILADVKGFSEKEVQDMLHYAKYNHKQYGYENFLLAFISESPIILQNIPEPQNIPGVKVQYVPLLLELYEEPKLIEIGLEGKRIAFYEHGDLLDDWAGSVKSNRKIK